MKMNVTFRKRNQTFHPQFGIVHNISDGGYERGYAEGYSNGLSVAQTVEDGIVNRTFSGHYFNDRLTNVGANAFYQVPAKSYNLPNVESVSANGFWNSSKATDILLPKAKTLNSTSLGYCYALKNVDLASCENLNGDVFRNCNSLAKLHFPSIKSIGANCFIGASSLATLVLSADAVCTLENTNAFTNTPIANGTGYIYVPAALVDTYKTAANWSTHASQIRAIEDYPDICGE
jgi:hypothetical protein